MTGEEVKTTSQATEPANYSGFFSRTFDGKKFRKSAFVGPFSAAQIASKAKWILVAAFPFYAFYHSFGWASQAKNAKIPPLLQQSVQDFDGESFVQMYQDHLKVIEPYWYNKEKRNTLSWEQLTEVDFLKSYQITFDEKQ